MSIDALKYLKDVRTAPNGEPITLREKAILWYLANAHNEDKRCAWPSIRTIAGANNVSERTVQEILRECVRKGVVWRRETFRENGSLSSNEWRFNELDGDPTTADLVIEEQRRLRGELMAARVNAKKRGEGLDDPEEESAAEISTDECGSQREFSHQASAETCATPTRDSAPPHAETCTTPTRDSAPPYAGFCTTPTRDSAPPEVLIELPGKDSQNPQGSSPENSQELSAAAAEEETGFANAWTRMLGELAQRGVLAEPEYLRMSVETTQLRVERAGELIFLTVGFSESSASILEFYADYAHDFTDAARAIGLDPGKTRLQFQPIQKAGSA